MHQAADDDRNLELFRFMSEVDRVKPGYVILENVPGFKDEKMNDTFLSGISTKSFASVAARPARVGISPRCPERIG